MKAVKYVVKWIVVKGVEFFYKFFLSYLLPSKKTNCPKFHNLCLFVKHLTKHNS